MESNPASVPLRDPKTWGTIPKLFQDLCDCGNLTGSDAVDCLRKTPAQSIAYLELAALADSFQYISIDGMPWTPTINGKDGLFKQQPVFAYQSGTIIDIPFIMGTNLNESALFVYITFPFKLTGYEYYPVLVDLYGEDDANKIIKYYNISLLNDEDIRPIVARLATDVDFRCPSRNMTASATKYNTNSAFFYHFIHVSGWNSLFYPGYSQCNNAVCHGNELPYVFDASSTSPLSGSWSTQEIQLSQLMQWYWGTFAKNQNPSNGNGHGNTWTSYNDQTQPTMMFDINESKIVLNYDTVTCNFWDSMNYTWIYS